MRLRRTVQCAKCPWKKSTNPHDIPNGYDFEKHKRLNKTIAKEGLFNLVKALAASEIHIMACHEAHEDPCLGWLMHQIGPGNNVPLRLKYFACENLGEVKLIGPQHENFEDTLPK
jgi:hypothetical protein